MSYILEAIKKADLKRKIGSVPDIHSDHDILLREPAHRPVWPYLLAIVLFFNAGLIGWWLKPWANIAPEKMAPVSPPIHLAEQGHPTPPLSQEQGKTPVSDDNASSTASPNSPPVASRNEAGNQVTRQTKPDGIPVQTLSQRLGDVTLSLSQQTSVPPPPQTATIKAVTSATATNTAKVPAAYLPAKTIISVRQTGDNSTKVGIPEDLLNSQPSFDDNGTIGGGVNEPDSNEDKAIEEPERAVFDINKIPFLYQLPESAQKKIPEITISFHSYRYRPSSRLVRLNGHIMHEGQNINKELTLEKIVPSGVVLLFEHKRFRVGL